MTMLSRFIDTFRRYVLAVPMLLLLVACQNIPPAERLLAACEAHTAGQAALVPLAAASALTQRQVSMVDLSEQVADRVCDGTVRNYTLALEIIEAEAMRLAIIASQGGNDGS